MGGVGNALNVDLGGDYPGINICKRHFSYFNVCILYLSFKILLKNKWTNFIILAKVNIFIKKNKINDKK